MSLITAVALANRREGKIADKYYVGRSRAVLERSFIAFRSSTWLVVLSGFMEPILSLLVFGYGVGHLVGSITLPDGKVVSYATFIVPGLLASSAMMGAIMDSTWNVFFKLRHDGLYKAMLATSLGPMDVAIGEVAWALLRGALYSTSFMLIVTPLGLIESWWGILAIPVGALISFAFASIGMAITSYFTSYQQLGMINIVLVPLTLFSGSLFPLSVMPDWLAKIAHWTPLTQGIELMRLCTLGEMNLSFLSHVIYFAIFIAVGIVLITRRLNALFMR